MSGILACGAYLPRHRLDRAAIATALGKGRRGGKGTRSVASFDEDATTLGVEAARVALASAPAATLPLQLLFATAGPPYLEKTNATAIHAALDLDRSVGAFDAIGSVRSGAGALAGALHSPEPALVVLADVRTGLAGGADERDGGDAGAALLVSGGDGPFIAELLGRATVTDEFLDRWRAPGATSAHRWEEHFGAGLQVEHGLEALAAGLAAAEAEPEDVDRLLVVGTNGRALKGIRARAGVPKEALGTDLTETIGNSATAHAGVLLTAALEQAGPSETIALIVVGDGAEAFVFRTTTAIEGYSPTAPLAAQLDSSPAGEVSYADFLSWRGMLELEPTRRPAPAPPAAPASHRTESWKFAFTGSRCLECDSVQVPAQRVCYSCRAVDRSEPVRLVDSQGTVVTTTVDRLAWSPSPPSAFAILDLDQGGRVQLEVTDAPGEVAPGDRMDLTFRRAFTRNDIHNYIWKARPIAAKEES
jgi:hydroxymethylglutaryl-CoA synthase